MKKFFFLRSGIIAILIIIMGYVFYLSIKDQILTNYLSSLQSTSYPIAMQVIKVLQSKELSSDIINTLLKEADDINYKSIRTLSYSILRNTEGDITFSSQNPDYPLLDYLSGFNDGNNVILKDTILTSSSDLADKSGQILVNLPDSAFLIRQFTPLYDENQNLLGNIELGFKPVRLARAIYNAQVTIIVFIAAMLISLFLLALKLSLIKDGKNRKKSIPLKNDDQLESDTKDDKITYEDVNQKMHDLFINREKEEKAGPKKDFLGSCEHNIYKSVALHNRTITEYHNYKARRTG